MSLKLSMGKLDLATWISLDKMSTNIFRSIVRVLVGYNNIRILF